MTLNKHFTMPYALKIIDVKPILNSLFEMYPEKTMQAKETPHLRGWFVGQVMIETKGIANPQVVLETINDFMENDFEDCCGGGFAFWGA